MFCRKCGNKLVEGARFCNRCGNQIATAIITEETSVTADPSQPLNNSVIIDSSSKEPNHHTTTKKPKAKLIILFSAIFLVVSITLTLLLINALTPQNNGTNNESPNTSAPQSTRTEYTATEIYNQAVQYVGEIVTYDRGGDELGLGTGFVISTDGKIVTNYHVIEDAHSADITINDKKYKIVSVLAYDVNLDLAVLKINATDLTAATISKNSVDVGSTVYAIGSSRGMTNSYSQGIVSYANRVTDGVTYIQHDASITHGNSGGPLLNAYGEVIGINTGGLSNSQNLNFAIVASELDKLVYGTQKTLAIVYDENHTPYQVLLDWLYNNATESDSEYISYTDQIDSEYGFSLVYDLSNGDLSLILLSETDDNAVFFGLFLKEDSNVFEYVGFFEDYIDSSNSSDTTGRLYGDTFTSSTRLSYTGHEGASTNMSSRLELFSVCACECIEWLDAVLDDKNINTTIRALGFKAYS